MDENSIPSEILLVISVDGVPVSKSSESQFWPLTELIPNPCFQKVFIIGTGNLNFQMRTSI